MIRLINIVWAVIIFNFSCFAYTDSTNVVKYSPEFKFTDGIYLSFDQVRNNSPVEKSRILTTTDYNSRDFFLELTNKKIFSFYDNMGEKIDVEVKNIWGYADNGVLFINVDNNFYRITIVGSICHFVAYVTTYTSGYPYDPYSNYYDYYSVRSNSRNEHTELKQFIIDFKTGKIFNYNTENLEVILMNDPELHDEYASLRRKKKKQQKFMYIRKYNERNPLFFPEK